ncbi:MAG: aldo/keto reductase, partial [Gammaproteobacteria bacterium]|nr:aldo/keto reductase [Gammaproteobacteria bacterium]
MQDALKPKLLQPQLGLGCLYPETAALISDALKNGIAFFDTSNVYDDGNAEISLGKELAKLPRESFQIATKAGCTQPKFKLNGSPQHILDSCKKSLTALQVEYIDLYYLHRVDPKIPIETSMEAFKQLLDEKKIKYVGLSEVTPTQIRRANAVCPISAIQIEYSPWSRHDEHNGVIQTCRELGIAIVTYSPLGRAFFTAEFNSRFYANDFRHNINRYGSKNIEQNIKLRERLNTFIQNAFPEKTITLSQFILAWQIHKGFIPIPSTTNLTHLRENIAATHHNFSPELFSAFDTLLNQLNFLGERYNSPKSSRIYNGVPFIPKNESNALLTTDPSITQINKITYEELHHITHQVAAGLSQKFDPKSVVAVHLPESMDYIIALLSIWKAGMIYFPLNNKSPVNTLHLQKAQAVLLDKNLYDELRFTTKHSASFEPAELCDQDWAYYIASSGTTSAPKIIRIRFESLMSRIRDHQQRMNIHKKNNDIMLALLNCAFDASIMEILSALTKGIPLFIAPESIRENVFSLPQLFSLAHQQGMPITTGIFVPSILKGMSPQQFPGLKSFLATGEAFEKTEQVKTWLDAGIKIFNGYGPTEVTFGASIVEVTEPHNIPLFFDNSSQQNNGLFSGLVCLCLKKENEAPNAKWTLLDSHDSEGEVFLSGIEGLGEYLDDPERNQKSFIPSKKYPEYFAPEVIEKIKLFPRVYRVFDIIKRIEDRFVFVRRSDRMIKRAGKQVDLEEMESRFRTCFPNMNTFIVYHNKLIRAYITSETIPNVSTLEGDKPNIYYYLNHPAFVSENKSNSKLKITFENLNPHARKILQNNETLSPTQQKVYEIWQKLFNEEMHITLNTDFTEELGGESLLCMQMTNQIWNTLLDQKILEQNSSTVEFSRYINKNKTIRKIAELVDACNSTYLESTEDNIFSFKQDISSNIDNETIIVSAILQIRR